MKKILVVEDEEDVAAFLTENLKRLGFDVAYACDGEAAMRKVPEFKPLVVILDIALPKVDGWEVLKWLKENHPEIIVILASVKQDLPDLEKAYELKADYYVAKPYKLEEIVKGINLICSLKGYLDNN